MTLAGSRCVTKQRAKAPQIDAKLLKGDYSRVEFSAEAYIYIADVLFRCTRYAPET
jgi:hypothetical protein